MRITQWGEYGVLCSTFLADKEQSENGTVGAMEIAKAHGIALEYAQQILQRLRRGGIIKSVRGPQGGYKLARGAREITLREVLLAAEGDTFEVICDTKPLHLPCCKEESDCGLRELWQGLKKEVDKYLNSYTLADLASSPNQTCHSHDNVVRLGQK
jgi:Rrf2 family transcriptional regulator, iron-sulfur cluster assembly transcription factor